MEMEALAAIVLIFGTPLGVVWLGLRYKLKARLAEQATRQELAELRREIAAVRESLSEMGDVKERLADLTLMVDDALRQALPRQHEPLGDSQSNAGTSPRRLTEGDGGSGSAPSPRSE